MSKLGALPAQNVINGFKGVIDFYMNYQACDRSIAGPGIPCARSWPRSPGHDRAPLVEARWPAFTWSASNWNSLDPYVQEAYRRTASESTLTGRDLFTKSFITDYFRKGQWDTLSKDPVFTPEECEMLPAVCAFPNGMQNNIPSGVQTKIILDTEDFDTCGNFDTVNSHFVCPKAGRLWFALKLLLFPAVANKNYDIFCVINGNPLHRTRLVPSFVSFQSHSLIVLLNVSLGDILHASIEHNDGVGTTDIGSWASSAWTCLDIAYIE